MTSPTASVRRKGGSALVAGLVALALLVVGGLLLVHQPKRWTASASLLVIPDQTASADTLAGLYDSLSRGQVVQSYASVADSSGFVSLALAPVVTTPVHRKTITTSVTSVPNTALVDSSATADSASLAERAAQAVADAAASRLSRTFNPYRIIVVSPAKGTATAAGAGRTTLLAVLAFVVVVAGVVVYQAAELVASRRERRSRPPSSHLRRPGDAAVARRPSTAPASAPPVRAMGGLEGPGPRADGSPVGDPLAR